jgi:hypothetical protein
MDTETDIYDNYTKIPEGFTLSQNYPNPFNPLTTISFFIPIFSKLELSIYNVIGKRIKTLFKKNLQICYHKIA